MKSRNLTSTDFFILALEKYNTGNEGSMGNTCRYVLELDGKLDQELFKNTIEGNATLQYLSSLSIRRRWMAIPKWKINNKKKVKSGVFKSDDLIPRAIREQKLSLEDTLFACDLVYRSNGNSAIIFSWHHLIMDGYGAVLLLKRIFGKCDSDITRGLLDYKSPPVRTRKGILWKVIKLFFVNAKLSIAGLFKKPLQHVSSNLSEVRSSEEIKVVSFTEKETTSIDGQALKEGAHFGRSPYYLACAARAVKRWLKKVDRLPSEFWVPVPQDQRKKGANGPLIGNYLNFLFYDLPVDILNSLSKSVSKINEQMVQQVKSENTKIYELLMRALRVIPLWIFYQFIKGPKGGSLASFLFTVAAEHPKELMAIHGHRVINAFSFPPNTYPPGITFAFMRFENKLQLMLLYYDHVLNDDEADNMIGELSKELISGSRYENS